MGVRSRTRLEDLLSEVSRQKCPTCGSAGKRCQFPKCILSVSRMRKSPFTSPSGMDMLIDKGATKFPRRLCYKGYREVTLRSRLLHRFKEETREFTFGTGNSNGDKLVSIDEYKRRILREATYRVRPRGKGVLLEVRVKFPTGKQAVGTERLRGVLFSFIPRYMGTSLFCGGLSTGELEEVMSLTRSRRCVHGRLPGHNLYTFITGKDMLPERSKVSSEPVHSKVTFRSPARRRIALRLPRGKGVANVKVHGKVALVINKNCRKGSALLGTLRLKICGRVTKSKERCIVASTATIGLHTRSNEDVQGASVSVFVGSLPGKGSAASFYARSTDKDASRTTGIVRKVRTKASLFLVSRSADTAGFVVHSRLVRHIVRERVRPVAPFVREVERLCRGCKVSAIVITKDSKTCFRVTSDVVRVSHCIPGSVAMLTGGRTRGFPRVDIPRRLTGGPTCSEIPQPSRTFRKGSEVGVGAVKGRSIVVGESAVSLECLRRVASDRRITTLNCYMQCTRGRLVSKGGGLVRVMSRLRRIVRGGSLTTLYRDASDMSYVTIPEERRVFTYLSQCETLELK